MPTIGDPRVLTQMGALNWLATGGNVADRGLAAAATIINRHLPSGYTASNEAVATVLHLAQESRAAANTIMAGLNVSQEDIPNAEIPQFPGCGGCEPGNNNYLIILKFKRGDDIETLPMPFSSETVLDLPAINKIVEDIITDITPGQDSVGVSGKIQDGGQFQGFQVLWVAGRIP